MNISDLNEPRQLSRRERCVAVTASTVSIRWLMRRLHSGKSRKSRKRRTDTGRYVHDVCHIPLNVILPSVFNLNSSTSKARPTKRRPTLHVSLGFVKSVKPHRQSARQKLKVRTLFHPLSTSLNPFILPSERTKEIEAKKNAGRR